VQLNTLNTGKLLLTQLRVSPTTKHY